jgi:molybdenum cofactor synthesis domain-containing protein
VTRGGGLLAYSAAKRPETAAALVIGTEILTGKVADQNLRAFAETCRAIGVRLERAVTILDERAVIAAEVRALSAAYDLVVTSGGVGPTHDDLTIDGVADAFAVDVVMSPEIEAMLRRYYKERITEGHLLMARIPRGARLVVTAAMPWPTVAMENVWILPGVPQLFALKMGVLESELGGGQAFVSQAVYTHLDEGNLKPMLDRVVAEHPAVMVGSYPQWDEPRYRTKVTFDGVSEEAVARAREALVALLPADALASID